MNCYQLSMVELGEGIPGEIKAWLWKVKIRLSCWHLTKIRLENTCSRKSDTEHFKLDIDGIPEFAKRYPTLFSLVSKQHITL